MANAPHARETVLEAGSIKSRLAKVYAEALIAAAAAQPDGPAVVDALGVELGDFVAGVLGESPSVAAFLASPAVGKRAKAAALQAALPGNASDLFRGLVTVLTTNGRLDLLGGVAAAYRQLLDDRAGRVRVKVTAASELTAAQREKLTATLAAALKQQPVLAVRVDPALIGGMVVQIGDRVIDSSVRSRLNNLRTLLLDKGSSYVL
ncbi:ATP synthase F1 subunit delta [Gemmata sp.]|uniref:ATP synthase F1 subunit delta n=1 Tax=Gemmata sp. TaxID=1914242 RepID=UPI003F6F1E59